MTEPKRCGGCPDFDASYIAQDIYDVDWGRCWKLGKDVFSSDRCQVEQGEKAEVKNG